ncbi:MAG: 3-methyl-2-oxobutanoate hydroxymethyltransferase [Dehalococcoidia bacterium]|jgi:3-methyl-2-oxobutanoate hydroxymethyltransferase|nr:3-methyl-2-oxobutanoate hydroxymethyltransferase [Dehalococcoidia bacterium]
MAKKKTVLDFMKMKEAGEKFSKLALYDYTSALLAEQAGLEMILVGDSMGNVVYGYDGTVPVTMDQMIYHSRAVRKGAPNTFIVGDLPFLSYQTSVEDAVRNAGRFYKEAGMDAVKLEGGRQMAPQIRAIAEAGMLVMAHIGLTPQSAAQLGGFRVQGNTAEAALRVLADAQALEQAGAFMVLLEGVPAETGQLVTQKLKVPTISVGAGPHCDGQAVLLSDLIGMYPVFTPKFVKRYATVGDQITKAVAGFVADIKSGAYPTSEHCYKMKDGETARLEEMLKGT